MKKKKQFKLEGYIFGALRRIDRWYPGRLEALKRQQKGPDSYECEQCHKLFSRKKRQIHVDHIDPVVDPSTGFVDWNTYIERLYVPADKRQILCKKDHQQKSNKENKKRKKK